MKFYPPHYLLLLSLCMLSTWYFGNTEPQSFYFMILGLSLIGLGFVFGVKFIRVQEIIRYFKKNK